MNATAELYRGELIAKLKWAGPLVTEQVLLRVATVPYLGDDDVYIREASAVVKDALATILQPRFDAEEAEIASLRAKADALEVEHARRLREFEEFRNAKTFNTIH